MSAEDFADWMMHVLECNAPPVDVVHVLRQLDVQVYRVVGTRWSGALNSSETTAEIWVRSEDALVRQRFTLAHELGHLLLHPLGILFRDDTFTGNWMETEANRFAAAFLMPSRFLATHAPLAEFSATTLASQFRVSHQAMTYRLASLGYPALQ
jgi:Zn-dependent peptidase ImmA (M78 family)